MPLRGEGHSDLVKDESPYFNSLDELDTWFTQPHDKLLGVVPYQPRPPSDSTGKLLVCHDYKGGYTESPSGLCYTFNFWRLCDAFVYFSHRRVTVPPSGWTNAAHKQGTRMLGTLIFEGDTADTLQLVVGRSGFTTTDNKIPISERYAVLLAELARQRGFDGYLLNVESSLKYLTNHARALAAWILLLRAQLRHKVGPQADVVWYDSVIYDGWVSYQNRLNAYNLPFFLASDSLFTNYWWQPSTQTTMSTYFTNVQNASSAAATKTLQDVQTGIDVYGRGQYGGGGYCCYRALTYTSPLGISTALFAPGWTWESATADAENNWTTWWDNDRKLWVGPPPGETVSVPDSTEGAFQPIANFFKGLPSPDPSRYVFYTHFSPGVGYSWFVEGTKVLDTNTKGWTDIDKQCPIGNLVWPCPTPSWLGGEQDEDDPTATTTLDMTDGYNGGNTLQLTVDCPGTDSDSDGSDSDDSNSNNSDADTTTKVMWLPVQSLAVTTGLSFEARIAYKTTVPDGVDLQSQIFIKPLPNEDNSDVVLTVGNAVISDLPQGWTLQVIDFTCTSTKQPLSSVVIGFIIGIKPSDPSLDVTFSLSLGELAVYPTPPDSSVSVGTPSVTSAVFTPSSDSTAQALQGVLTWDTASTFDPIDVEVDSPESTTPAWLLEDTSAYRYPTFVYFNVYVAQLDDSGNADPSNAVFIGTTGLDGRANRFYLDPVCMPSGSDKWSGGRFYVQGVTDRGDVLPWEMCATVDYKNSTSSSKSRVRRRY